MAHEFEIGSAKPHGGRSSQSESGMRCIVTSGDRHIDLALLQQPHQKGATHDVNNYANLLET
jgi:hypothetical protein